MTGAHLPVFFLRAMNESTNRVKKALDEWRVIEQEALREDPNIFKNTRFLKQKLEAFDNIASKYMFDASPEEKVFLTIVNQKRDLIEKNLPWWERLKIFLVNDHRKVIRTGRAHMDRQEQYHDWMCRKVEAYGFASAVYDVRKNMLSGKSEFSVPISAYVSEHERLDVTLSFSMDKFGDYQMRPYKAKLHDERKPGQDRERTMELLSGDLVDARQAYALLAGRAVALFQGLPPSGDKPVATYYQFDFNDKNDAGEYQIKKFYRTYRAYEQLEALGVQPSEAHRQGHYMENGERVTINLPRPDLPAGYKQVMVESNPQKGNLKFFSMEGEELTEKQALRDEPTQKELRAKQALEKQQAKEVKPLKIDSVALRNHLNHLGIVSSRKYLLDKLQERIERGERVQVTIQTPGNEKQRVFLELAAPSGHLIQFNRPAKRTKEQAEGHLNKVLNADDFQLKSTGQSPIQIDKQQDKSTSKDLSTAQQMTSRIQLDMTRINKRKTKGQKL